MSHHRVCHHSSIILVQNYFSLKKGRGGRKFWVQYAVEGEILPNLTLDFTMGIL